MYLTNFERQLAEDQKEVYKNCREIFILDLQRYKSDSNMLRYTIRYNEYDRYIICKKFIYNSYRRMKVSALTCIKYMFVYARLI